MPSRLSFTLRGLTLAAVLAAAPLAAGPVSAQTSIRAVVNNEAVTSYQVDQRAAFLRLRREEGNVAQKALDEIIEETLKRQEIRRRGIEVPDAAVEEAYGRFAADNNLSAAQLEQVFSQAGFSATGFKDFIRTQMAWSQAVQQHVRAEQQVSEQDAVQRMLQAGGDKPETTEYTLQQVVFVVPQGDRGSIGARSNQANAMRSRFQSCNATYDLAAQLRDVSVRDLGRVAQPELPSLWREDIMRTNVGGTTPVKQTDRGVEFIAVCNARSISDDRAAAMVFSARDLERLGEEGAPDAAFLGELRENARIVRR